MEDQAEPRPHISNIHFVWYGILIIVVLIVIAFAVPRGVPDEPPIKMSFRSPTSVEKTINNTTYWDVRVEVKDISREDGYWPDLQVQVISSDGDPLSVPFNLMEDDPSEYDDGEGGRVNVEAWYTAGSPRANWVDRGDSVKITGLQESHGGSTIRVWRYDEVIGSFKVPDLD